MKTFIIFLFLKIYEETQKGPVKSFTSVLNLPVLPSDPLDFTVNYVRSLFKIQISNTVTLLFGDN